MCVYNMQSLLDMCVQDMNRAVAEYIEGDQGGVRGHHSVGDWQVAAGAHSTLSLPHSSADGVLSLRGPPPLCVEGQDLGSAPVRLPDRYGQGRGA